MTTMDNMTGKEEKVVEELRRRTINEVTPKMLEDISLFYRFAKARDFNLDEAESMLRKHISWRNEMKIDTILTDYEPPEVLLKYAPTTFICFDKEGCVVRLQDVGRADPKGLFSVTKKTDFAKFLAFLVEKDIERVIKKGGNLAKPMYSPIDDFENLTYSVAMNIKNLQNILYLLKVFLDNYPEVIRNVTLINAPSYFAWFYAAFKPILSPAIIQKVRIFGRDGWKEVLSEEIEADDLPAYLGGNKTDPGGNPLCETFIQRGRPIPKRYYIQNRTKKFAQESDVVKLVVMPFSKEEIFLKVEERNSYIEWEFQAINGDLDFLLFFETEPPENLEPVVLIPKQRIDTSDEPAKGCYRCERVGNYTIVFDNSYSWYIRKKFIIKLELQMPTIRMYTSLHDKKSAFPEISVGLKIIRK